MASIYLSPYSIKIRKRFTKDLINFGEVFKTPSLIEHIQNHFEKLKVGFYDDESIKSIFKVTHLSKDVSSYTIHGVIESGEYGIESKFYDRKGSHKYSRKKDHAEVMPFYFLIYVPSDSSIGFLILQRFGQYGIAKSFNENISNYIKNLNKEHALDIDPITSTKVLHKIINDGRIRKATFTRYTLPKDIEDYFPGGVIEQKGYMQLSLVAARNSFINIKEKLNKVLFGTSKMDSLLKVDNFPFDEMKVKVEYQGGTRTISIGDKSFKAFYDITDEVDLDSNGHPNFTSIQKIASNLLIDFNSMTT